VRTWRNHTDIRRAAGEKGVAGVDFPPTSQAVAGDPARLREVVVNLLGTLSSLQTWQVICTAEVQQKTRSGVELDFAVRDTGIGIPKRQARNDFRRFHPSGQFRNSKVRRKALA